MSEIKSRLGDLLYERKITQIKLAEEIVKKFGEDGAKVHKTVISDIVNNKRSTLNRKHLGMIAATLNITDMNELLYRDDTPVANSVPSDDGTDEE